MLAFSTCWNNSRHTDGEAMIGEIVDLGFSHIELSHGMTVAKLPGIRKAFQRGLFTCAGVHNFFPAPVEVMIDAPDAYEFTSHRPHDRQRALDLTLRTLEIAAEFNAGYLVLHMGSVPMNPRKWSYALTEKLAAGGTHQPDFVKAKLALVRKREKIGPLYYQRALDALDTIAGHAAKAGVKLAVESRSHFEDMPTEREMLALQHHFADNPWVGYWHDFGHVQLKHNLGLLDHPQWLERIAPHLIGGHVHDVEWPARDHRVPFGGMIDYAPLLEHFPPGCPLVWELSSTREAAEIRRALERWQDAFPGRGLPASGGRSFGTNPWNTRMSDLEWLQAKSDEANRQEAEYLLAAKAVAAVNGKEPFDYETLCGLYDPSSELGVGVINHREAAEALERRYYIDYPAVTNLRDFAAKLTEYRTYQ